MLCGPLSIADLLSDGRSYLTSSGPKHCAQTWVAPRSLVAPHSRQKR
jgi:hypothetical protein